MNSCNFVARLGKDPELKTAGGTQVVNFSGAVRRQFTKDGQPDSDWLNFVAFGKTAEFIAKFFKKGSEIAITSRAQTSSYEKDGIRVYKTDFIVDNVSFTGGSKVEGISVGNSQNSVPQGGFVPVDVNDDDLPF